MMQTRKQLALLAAALGGIPVWGCLPGSAAARLGVRYGDVILSVNGQATPDVERYVEARNLRDDGLTIVVFRDGREHTLEVSLETRSAPMTRAQLERAAEQLASAPRLPSDGAPPSDDRSGA